MECATTLRSSMVLSPRNLDYGLRIIAGDVQYQPPHTHIAFHLWRSCFPPLILWTYSSLSNLLVNDQPCPILTKSSDVSVETILRSLYDKKVTITSECGGSVESQPMKRSSCEDGIAISDDRAFKVTDNSNHSFTAKLSMSSSHSGTYITCPLSNS